MNQTTLVIDVGDRFEDARTFLREHPEKTLTDLIEAFAPKFPADKCPPESWLTRPLSRFILQPASPKDRECVQMGPACSGELARELDQLWSEDQAGTLDKTGDPEKIDDFPEDISEQQAVKIAYHLELNAIADFLGNGLSVLVVCDKILTELIYKHVVSRARKAVVTDTDAAAAQRESHGARADRATRGDQTDPAKLFAQRFNNLKTDEILVIRSLDMMDNPAAVEMLYQHTAKGVRPQLLAFLDPSLEVKKVLSDRFSVHVPLMGLPRYAADTAVLPPGDGKPPYCVTRLLTRNERRVFQTYDPEQLYKNVAGLNAVQFRNAMQYVGTRVAENTDPREVFRVIRQFKTSSTGEIEIPDTTFEDIGGYDHVKFQLQRIVDLIGGPIQGMDDRMRTQLIPRGFVFHGPPGTGKTLFAKAIANEMNATIQMISGPEIMDKYVGESENKLRRIFATARRNAPAVVFFDEFDSIASQRSSYSDGGSRANNAVVAQLLTELDGFRQDQTVLVIGTTNRIDIIDEALLRPSRFRPLEIGRPDPVARRRVAEIHARSFGVDTLLKDLCRLATRHLPAWRAFGEGEDRTVPQAFLDELYAQHGGYKTRYKADDDRTGFLRDLKAFFTLMDSCREAPAEKPPGLESLRARVVAMGRRYGIDLEADPPPDLNGPEGDAWLTPMKADIRDLFETLSRYKSEGREVTPEQFWNTVLELVAEYTDQFNNDEIRAVFQEAGLERHLEGRLITPRYLGQKIGLIRKRRDEREKRHLTETRR